MVDFSEKSQYAQFCINLGDSHPNSAYSLNVIAKDLNKSNLTAKAGLNLCFVFIDNIT